MEKDAPFLDVTSFVTEEVPREVFETSAPPSTPFVALYNDEDAGGLVDPESEEYISFLNELYDEEFDEALDGLVNDAAALYETNFTQEQGAAESIGYQAERFLTEHFAPLVTEIESMLDALTTDFRQRNLDTLTEEEIDAIVDRYQPATNLSPVFEEFFGKIKKGS